MELCMGEKPDPNIQLVLTHQPTPEQIKQLWDGLRGNNLLYVPPPNHTPLVITVCDEEGNILGGLEGGTSWNWLHVDNLWLREGLRGQGYGVKLMQMAEAEAVRRGCNHAMVDTFDFQAPGFYQKLGYVEWGVLEDFPGGHRRIYYRKDL
jgi:GNAT superfamily N-acetyltransferase